MKKIVLLAFVLTIFSLAVTETQFIMPVVAESGTIRVPDDYSTIQEAVDAASEGDIIQVAAGWYWGAWNISKRHLTLVGENRETFISGGFTLYGAYNITIRSFTITEAIQIYRRDHAPGDLSQKISIVDNTLLDWIFMQNSKENVIANNTITSAYTAIRLDNSWHTTITGNLITNNRGNAIEEMFLSTGNTITNNVISNNGGKGIRQYHSGYDIITGNTISNNQYGIYIEGGSKNNIIHHNNFINNTIQAYVTTGYTNIWDDDYPSGGNYWSNYTGVDLYSGPYQNVTGSDGIGDTPHNINANNTDTYPLMNRWNPVHNINTGLDYATIQDAINAPETLDGHTIRVEEGTYYEHVVVNKSVSLVGQDKYHTVIDGNGTGTVINLTANNVHISGFTIRRSGPPPDSGIHIFSSGNKISHNIITNNGNGIWLDDSSNNNLNANTASNNQYGILINNSSDNAIFHNNFVNNTQQVNSNGSTNTWDNGYPSGGNYWSDYTGVDLYRGPFQNETGSDGIGDTLYVINVNNKDNYPFMNSWGPVHNIITGLNYETIQGAINAPDTLNGHVIRVDAGTYYEHVVVNKSVSLIGEQMGCTVIDGAGSWNVVYVTVDKVNISGFTILHGDYCGIELYDSSNNNLTGNTVSSNGGYGIRIMHSNNNSLVGNTFSSNNGDGIEFYYSSNNTVSGNTVSSNGWYGIELRCSNNNTLMSNNVSNNRYGIELSHSKNNTISGNIVLSNGWYGIWLRYSSNNTVVSNTVSNNYKYGISLFGSDNNVIFHNNFVNNTQQVDSVGSTNSWNNSLEGNYWSNYTGVDSNHDGIGDSYHVINANNTDYYPLMGMFHSFNTSLGYNVNVISNSTIEDFEYFESNSTIKMYVSNMTTNQTFGFCRVCIPKGLMPPPYTVIIDDGLTEALHFNDTIYDNDTHRWIYFAYEHSTHEVVIQSLPPPDTTPPTISILSPENKTYTTSSVSLSFTVDEATSWMGYSLDRQTNATIAGNTTISGLSDGSHSLIIYASDIAGNTGASEIIYFSIETQQAEPFPTWIVATIVIIAGVGAALLVYFAKVKKTTEKVK